VFDLLVHGGSVGIPCTVVLMTEAAYFCPFPSLFPSLVCSTRSKRATSTCSITPTQHNPKPVAPDTFLLRIQLRTVGRFLELQTRRVPIAASPWAAPSSTDPLFFRHELALCSVSSWTLLPGTLASSRGYYITCRFDCPPCPGSSCKKMTALLNLRTTLSPQDTTIFQ
jgi:hypothetical protein